MRFLITLVISIVFLMSAVAQNNPLNNGTNSGYSFTAPKGFVQSKSQNTYINNESASSILFYHLTTIGYKQYIDSLNIAYFKSQNLTVSKQYSIEERGVNGKIIQCEYMVDTIAFDRLFFVTGDTTQTVLFLINYPASMRDDMKLPILKSILSIKYE